MFPLPSAGTHHSTVHWPKLTVGLAVVSGSDNRPVTPTPTPETTLCAAQHDSDDTPQPAGAAINTTAATPTELEARVAAIVAHAQQPGPTTDNSTDPPLYLVNSLGLPGFQWSASQPPPDPEILPCIEIIMRVTLVVVGSRSRKSQQRLVTHTLTVLIDSGAMFNCLSNALAKRLGLHRWKAQRSVACRGATDLYKTHHATEFVSAALETGNYSTMEQLYIMPSNVDLILGTPWLKKTGAIIDVARGQLLIPRHGLHTDPSSLFTDPSASFRVDYPPTNSTDPTIEVVSAKRMLRDHTRFLRHAPQSHEVCVLRVTARDSATLNSVRQHWRSSGTPLAHDRPQEAVPPAPPPDPLVDPIEPDVRLFMEKHADIMPEDLPLLRPPQRSVEMTIELAPNFSPRRRSPYRLTPRELECLKERLTAYLEHGIISPSQSPFSAPILFAKKADGGLRLCVDYRELNAATVKDTYPLPNMEELLDELGDFDLHSTLDLHAGYHQIYIAAKDRPKTAFTCALGSFEFNTIPFGLTNAPPVFMRLMNNLLSNFIASGNVRCYLDDIIISTRGSREDHLTLVGKVLDTLRRHQLWVNPLKSHFCKAEVKYLGHIISREGRRMDPSKVQAILDWPRPRSVRDIQSFIGVLQFLRRYLDRLASVVAPLTDLTKKEMKGKPLPWTDEHEQAFVAVKQLVTSAPILAHPDLEKPWEIYLDFSTAAMGAVLMQDGNVVAYASRKLSGAERNYSPYEGETATLIWCLQIWRHYLHGNTTVTAWTDHNPLTRLLSKPHLTSKDARWLDILAEFPNLDIRHIAGLANTAADGLSRRPDYYENHPAFVRPVTQAPASNLTSAIVPSTAPTGDTMTFTPDARMLARIVSSYEADPLFKKVLKALGPDSDPGWAAAFSRKFRLEPNGVLTFSPIENSDAERRICIGANNRLKMQLIQEAHDPPVAGHLGYDKTYARLSELFYWPRMYESINKFTQSCETCARSKSATGRKRAMLRSLGVPLRPWESISMDFVTDLTPDEDGYNTLLVVVCRLSKMAHFIPCKSTMTASECATLIFDHVVRLHGMPAHIVHDQDKLFIANLWRLVWPYFGTELHYASTGHAQSDGQTEIVNKTVGNMARCYIDSLHKNWSRLMAPFEFAYNSAETATTGLSPFFVVLGYEPLTPSRLLLLGTGVEPRGLYNDIPGVTPGTQEWLQARAALHRRARDAMALAQTKQAMQANRTRQVVRYQAGDRVWLSTYFLRLNTPTTEPKTTKFLPKYIGPFIVLHPVPKHDPFATAFALDMPDHFRCRRTHNADLLKPYRTNDESLFPDRYAPTPQDIVVDGAAEYEVEDILDHSYRGPHKTLHFLINWVGYPMEYNTWEPEDLVVNCPKVLDNYLTRINLDRSALNTVADPVYLAMERRRANARRDNVDPDFDEPVGRTRKRRRAPAAS